MPIYEYICEACGMHLDLFQKINEPPPSSCKSCGAHNALKKRISLSAFHLKGGGWYSELYASASKAKADASGDAPSKAAADNNAPSAQAKQAPSAPSPCAGCPAASSAGACAQKP